MQRNGYTKQDAGNLNMPIRDSFYIIQLTGHSLLMPKTVDTVSKRNNLHLPGPYNIVGGPRDEPHREHRERVGVARAARRCAGGGGLGQSNWSITTNNLQAKAARVESVCGEKHAQWCDET